MKRRTEPAEAQALRLQIAAAIAALVKAPSRAEHTRLIAERKAGELLAQLEREQGGSGRYGSSDVGQTSEYSTVLDESHTTRQDANRWQTVSASAEVERSC